MLKIEQVDFPPIVNKPKGKIAPQFIFYVEKGKNCIRSFLDLYLSPKIFAIKHSFMVSMNFTLRKYLNSP